MVGGSQYFHSSHLTTKSENEIGNSNIAESSWKTRSNMESGFGNSQSLPTATKDYFISGQDEGVNSSPMIVHNALLLDTAADTRTGANSTMEFKDASIEMLLEPTFIPRTPSRTVANCHPVLAAEGKDTLNQDFGFPDLVGNINFSTPSFSFQFSPFNHVVTSTNSTSSQLEEHHHHSSDKNQLQVNIQSSHDTSATSGQSTEQSIATEHAILPHIPISTIPGSPVERVARVPINPIPCRNSIPSSAKIKVSTSTANTRQPQKRYSNLPARIRSNASKNSAGSDFFGIKDDGKIRLTTNYPREVQVIHPISRERLHVYSSCSEAARLMKVNRSKLSRICRAGGGKIGDYLYQYIDME